MTSMANCFRASPLNMHAIARANLHMQMAARLIIAWLIRSCCSSNQSKPQHNSKPPVAGREASGTMKAKMPTVGKYERTPLTLLRAAKSRDQYKYSPGGREKRRTRPIPSLPKLVFADRGDQNDTIGDNTLRRSLADRGGGSGIRETAKCYGSASNPSRAGDSQ